MTQTPSVSCVALSDVVCLHTLQKVPLMSSSYTRQLNLFSQVFEYFLFIVQGQINSLQAFLDGGSAISESEQLDRFSVWGLELALKWMY